VNQQTETILSTLDPLEVVECLIKREIINRHAVRNFFIKKDYAEMRKNLSPSDSKRLLMDKYNLGFKTIEYIVYQSKN
jgi:hypothetical protein